MSEKKCVHEWRRWPYSKDEHCILCGYMIIGDVHYPLGKWLMPEQPMIELQLEGIKFVVPESAKDNGWRVR